MAGSGRARIQSRPLVPDRQPSWHPTPRFSSDQWSLIVFFLSVYSGVCIHIAGSRGRGDSQSRQGCVFPFTGPRTGAAPSEGCPHCLYFRPLFLPVNYFFFLRIPAPGCSPSFGSRSFREINTALTLLQKILISPTQLTLPMDPIHLRPCQPLGFREREGCEWGGWSCARLCRIGRAPAPSFSPPTLGLSALSTSSVMVGSSGNPRCGRLLACI